MIKQPEKYQDFQDPQAHPRYTGIATFFRTPASQQTDDVDIGIIGVPFDGGVTNRSGTRHGPRAVREQSTLLRRINAVTRVTPFATARVRDLGDCWIEQPYELQGALKEIEAFYRTVIGRRHRAAVGRRRSCHQPADPARRGGERPGGDDPYRRPLRHRRRLHGLALPPRRAVPPGGGGRPAGPEAGDPDRHPRHHQRSRHVGLQPAQRHAGAADGGVRRQRLALCRRGGAPRGRQRPDLSDASTSTASIPARRRAPERRKPAGITALQALRLLRELRGIDFVGGDLVEVSPPFDVGSLTAFNGASVLFEILCSADREPPSAGA